MNPLTPITALLAAATQYFRWRAAEAEMDFSTRAILKLKELREEHEKLGVYLADLRKSGRDADADRLLYHQANLARVRDSLAARLPLSSCGVDGADPGRDLPGQGQREVG
jgi:hypothetical protein